MNSASMDRRVAHRFAVRCKGELAAGSSVTTVVVSDMSVTGCGIEVPDAAEGLLAGPGILSLQPTDGTEPPVMLPVVISNHRVEGCKVRFGLQFRRLTLVQMRNVIGVLDGKVDF